VPKEELKTMLTNVMHRKYSGIGNRVDKNAYFRKAIIYYSEK